MLKLPKFMMVTDRINICQKVILWIRTPDCLFTKYSTTHSENKHIQKFKQIPNTITSDYWIYFTAKHQINSLNLCLTLSLLTCHFSGWCQCGWIYGSHTIKRLVWVCVYIFDTDGSAGSFSIFYLPSLICLRIGFLYVYEHIRWIYKPNTVELLWNGQ